MYRDIWAIKGQETPSVGDFVISEYGERGIILAISDRAVSIGVFGLPDMRYVEPFNMHRWDVRR